jgi:hypothetical protein
MWYTDYLFAYLISIHIYFNVMMIKMGIMGFISFPS